MSALFDAIAWVLSFFYSLWPSYGGAIILLTLAIMVIMTPLTLKGTRSMMAMQRLQPEMKRIQDKYKDDREKLNEELLAFYRENNINPVGGCLPLLVQMPVFIVLYRVIIGLTVPASNLGSYTGWTSGLLGQGSTPVAPPEAVTERGFEPAYLDHSSDLYQSLVGSFQMDFLGLDLAQSTSQAIGSGILTALPYIAMIGIVGLTGWYQQRQMQARNTNSAPNPQQQTMQRVMIFFLPAISIGLPAGVVLYFIVSNLYRVGQQAYITHTMFNSDTEPIPAVSAKADDGKKDKGGGKGGTAPAKPKPKKPKGGGGAARAKGKKKTFTSDPRRKSGGAPEIQARGRKKRK